MRAIGLLTIILLAVGCAGTAPPGIGGDDTNDPPPKVKEPPQPKDGAGTAPECDGVTERGQCDDGVALSCEISDGVGQLRRKDCRALGKQCVQDQDRGAVCEAIAGPGPDAGDGCGGLTFEGQCDGNTATWCSENRIHRWECGNSQDGAGNPLTCDMIEDFGAFCVGSSNPPPPPPPSSNCPAVGFAGICSGADTTGDGIGDTVIYCVGAGDATEVQVTCNAGNYAGKGCEIRNNNAWCYTPQTSQPNECELIGYMGVCQNDSTVRWCNTSTGQFHTQTCTGGTVCKDEMDAGSCGPGAFCCDP